MTAAGSVTTSPSEKDAIAEKAAKGLKGIVAADTRICDVDGEEGKLIYRGYNIHDLAKKSTFEETAYLLFKGGWSF
jgi:citrate synthase